MTDELRLRRDGLEWREVEGEIVALDVDSSTYLGVNGSAAVLWPALVDGTSRGELVTKLTEAYGVDEEAAARDVDTFLASLAEKGLLEQ